MIRRALHIVGSPDKLTNHSVLEVLAGLHALELARVALQAVGELPQAIFVVIPVRLRDRCDDLFRLEVLFCSTRPSCPRRSMPARTLFIFPSPIKIKQRRI